MQCLPCNAQPIVSRGPGKHGLPRPGKRQNPLKQLPQHHPCPDAGMLDSIQDITGTTGGDIQYIYACTAHHPHHPCSQLHVQQTGTAQTATYRTGAHWGTCMTALLRTLHNCRAHNKTLSQLQTCYANHAHDAVSMMLCFSATAPHIAAAAIICTALLEPSMHAAEEGPTPQPTPGDGLKL